MQSNIEEQSLTGTGNTFAERLRRFFRRHRNAAGMLCLFGALHRGILAVTDSRKFMIAMHAISFLMVAVCLWMAFRTGKYAYYCTSAGTITVLSCLWPEFTTRVLDKWQKDADGQRKRD